MDRSSIDDLKRQHRLSDLVRRHTKLRKASNGFMGLCPFHQERTPSFHVNDQRGSYKCFGCGAYGDLIDFLMEVRGASFQAIVSELQGKRPAPEWGSSAIQQRHEKEAVCEDERRRIAQAHATWLKREPVEGTLAERYLRETRGILSHIPSTLGFVRDAYCSPLEEAMPALIAPLQDSNGHVTAVQQIFLCSETLDAWRDDADRRIKRTSGVMRDGCVRLGLPDQTLGLAGSVEDALAAACLFSLPVWATCGEARFERVWIPDEITRLVIFADSDPAGMRAAKSVERKHWGKREVIIHEPTGAKDWCQIAMQRNAA